MTRIQCIGFDLEEFKKSIGAKDSDLFEKINKQFSAGFKNSEAKKTLAVLKKILFGDLQVVPFSEVKPTSQAKRLVDLLWKNFFSIIFFPLNT